MKTGTQRTIKVQYLWDAEKYPDNWASVQNVLTKEEGLAVIEKYVDRHDYDRKNMRLIQRTVTVEVIYQPASDGPKENES